MFADVDHARLVDVGHARLRGVVDRDRVAAMEDRVWRHLARRGISRDDRATWPTGSVGKLQGLRHGRVFDAFAADVVQVAVQRLLGTDTWTPATGWGPALITFPQPGPWEVRHRGWHFDLPARGPADQLPAVRLFGYIAAVIAHGGAPIVVEGSHEVVRRMLAASPDADAGGSARLRNKLIRRHPWFRALCAEGERHEAQFMRDGDELDGIPVRAIELTADPGDVVVMMPWTMHCSSMNCSPSPRLMVTHSVYRGQYHVSTDHSGQDREARVQAPRTL